jgi:hypothetical protein
LGQALEAFDEMVAAGVAVGTVRVCVRERAKLWCKHQRECVHATAAPAGTMP